MTVCFTLDNRLIMLFKYRKYLLGGFVSKVFDKNILNQKFEIFWNFPFTSHNWGKGNHISTFISLGSFAPPHEPDRRDKIHLKPIESIKIVCGLRRFFPARITTQPSPHSDY